MYYKEILDTLENIMFISKHLKYNLPVGMVAHDIKITCGNISLTLESVTGEEKKTKDSIVKEN